MNSFIVELWSKVFGVLARISLFALVEVVGAKSLELEFDNGVRKRVNLRRELYGPIFEPMRDPAYFAGAYLDPDSRTVTWPNGADFAPDFLYRLEPEAVLTEAALA